MRNFSRLFLIGLVACTLSGVAVADDPGAGPLSLAQSAADSLRETTAADIAFLPSAILKSGGSKDNLASVLAFPNESFSTLNLTGAQLRAALERSVSLLPQTSTFFLQISGAEVTYRRANGVSPRIVDVRVNKQPLDDGRTYVVAMPTSLARGGYGYFKVWNMKTSLNRNFESMTLEQILKEKRGTDSNPRYTAVD
ncbi:MAG: 5'-nucleotidase C-terminal domain-containing protein [Armatimonadetes bacterium]|nr:5'-nucleotidase C-terminal domain-containing protein [Armatimonadota bacterium]